MGARRSFGSRAKLSYGEAMRLRRQTLTDHATLKDINDNDHHPPGESFDILINSQSIAGLTAWEYRQTLNNTGHKAFRGILRGVQNVDIQGHGGTFFVASDTSQDCSSVSIQPYGASYVTSYMGQYSRIHGDSYLSPRIFGQNAIQLRDAYIDGDEVVLEFYNSNAAARNLTVYGMGAVK